MAFYVYAVLIVSLVLIVIAAAYLAYVAGRREKGGDIILRTVDRVYTDVHTLFVLIAALLSLRTAAGIFHPEAYISWIALAVILTADAFIGISYVMSMIRQIKAGQILRNTLIVVLYRKFKAFVKLCLGGKLFGASVLLLLLGYALIDGILFDVGVDINQGAQEPIFTVLLLLFNAAAVYFAAKSLLSLSQIMTAVKEISSGNLDYALNSSGISVAFLGFAEDIKNIQGGMKKAVDEAVKGERMKTELITNVSHDLKTPLTSIVNYVDLLKNEDLNNQKADEYVNILEEKSERLKQLIEDLVEASKASSGNLPVNAEKVDLHELVMQACGEYEEKIKKAELWKRL
jgi:signal transduction histidine kinase